MEEDQYAPGPHESSREFSWPLLDLLPARLAAADVSAEICAAELREAQADLRTRFSNDEPVETLVHARARLIDVVLCEIWPRKLSGHVTDWSLVAVGGYGRGELHPYSDVDLLILVPTPLDDAGRGALERFVTFLWDIGLEVGHSVRTIAECREEATANVEVMTTLVEARLLAEIGRAHV